MVSPKFNERHINTMISGFSCMSSRGGRNRNSTSSHNGAAPRHLHKNGSTSKASRSSRPTGSNSRSQVLTPHTLEQQWTHAGGGAWNSWNTHQHYAHPTACVYPGTSCFSTSFLFFHVSRSLNLLIVDGRYSTAWLLLKIRLPLIWVLFRTYITFLEMSIFRWNLGGLYISRVVDFNLVC